jgi:hypothetical protein
MYAADHDTLFKAPATALSAPSRLSDVDFEAAIARGRLERSRQFARLFDQAAAALKRLLH